MNILIVEDERVTQMSLIRMLNSCFPDIEIIGTARTVKETLEFLRSYLHSSQTRRSNREAL